jgi:DNA-binding IclR family transcriptional regulator
LDDEPPFPGASDREAPIRRRSGRGAADGGETAQDRQFVTALARGLDILGCFNAAKTEIGGAEIASRLGLPQPTVWRLCHTMTKLGFLVPAPGDKLRPGIPVLRLGYTALSALSPGELVRPHLQELADRFGAAAGVAVRDGSHMRFVERCEGESQLLLSLRVGSLIPIASSAMGWAYLAGLSAQERDALVEEVKPDPRIWRVVEPPFRRAMKDFAKDGYIVNAGAFHPGYNTVAIPVRGPDGRPAYTMNCGGAAAVLSVGDLRRHVAPRLIELSQLLESVE